MSEDGKSATPETLEDALKVIEKLTADVDEWKTHSRTWEDRAKANKEAAAERDALKTELDSLKAEKDANLDDAGKLQKRLDDLEAALKAEKEGRTAAEMSALKTRIGASKGLPDALVELLKGEDEEAIGAHADALLAAIPKPAAKPGVPGQGKQGEPIEEDKMLAAFASGFESLP